MLMNFSSLSIEMIGRILGLMRQSKQQLHRMAAYWRSKWERENSSLSLSRSRSRLRSAKKRGKRTKAVVCLHIPDPTAVIKRERENERTIHAHTFRITHGKPCAAIEEGYYTNPVLIFLSQKKISPLYCAPIRREKERTRAREKEKGEREKKTLARVGVRHIEYRCDCIVLNSSHQHDGFLLLTNTHIHQVKFFLLFYNNRRKQKGEKKKKKI